uniref:Small ribosomal subunit protein uS8c n=1 Tax=Gastrodia longistyla TaxID=2861180 RepID=A0A8F7CDA1_9ASPA|nr:ribosomal protein S8 [Gastrodia longistyla]QXU60598.1 ribosomal protein S8 [Gastrodia longistyla]UVG40916.1 ribosomal protein S8 [Gastrodia longistyla]
MGKDIIYKILTSIRNVDENKTKIKIVKIASNNITNNIIRILLQEGFIKDVRINHISNKIKLLVLTLRYKMNNNKKTINFKNKSFTGLQIYSNYKKIPRVLGGIGILILSTSLGLMTDKEAKRKRIGGEVLCYIW